MARKSRLLTDDEKRRIVERYQEGEAASTIADSFGRANSAIFRVLHAAGVNISSKHPRQRGGLKSSKKKLRFTMARAGRPPAKTSNWRRQLAALVTRIREADPGVTQLEVDLTSGRYTVNRITLENGELT
jgi:hypothetical protein